MGVILPFRKSETSISVNNSYEAKPIEIQLQEITTNNEPISADAPIIYTARAEGVLAGYDIRTDRFDIAIEAMDRVQKTKIAERETRMELKKGGKEGQSPANTLDNEKSGT